MYRRVPKSVIIVFAFASFTGMYCDSTVEGQQIARGQTAHQLKEPARHEIHNGLNHTPSINQRYEEMLRNNRARQATQQNYHYPDSYGINGSQKAYVRKQLPSRLIPPGRANPERRTNETNNSPYSLQQSSTAQFSGVARPSLRGTESHLNIQNVAPSRQNYYPQSSQPNVMVNPTATVPNRHPATQPPVRHTRLPAIVQPPSKRRLPARAGSSFSKVENGQIIAASQPIESQPIPRSSRIPFDTDDNTKVTRARILLVQDIDDPIGQAEPNQDDTSGGIQDDPFADPEANQSRENSQLGNSFGDPPSDLDQQEEDPFADPPTQDPTTRQGTQDPFGDPPNRLQETDPFPNNPNDIRPNQPLDQSPVLNNDRVNNSNEQTQNPEKKPEVILGPFKSRRGFEPSPILPAPPQREFGNAITQVVPAYQEVPEYYDQPTFFGSGFDKSQLYEGITHEGVETTQYCESASCQPLPFARPRLFNRICRNVNCANPGCTGCMSNTDVQSLNTEFDNSYLSQRVNQRAIDSECLSCGDMCFAPMFYVSVFGGYTQLEPVGPFGVSNQIIPFAPITTVSVNDGYGLGISLGQYQGPNLRTELEFVYRSNQANSITDVTTTINNFAIDGSFETYAGMMNLLWDFEQRPLFGNLQPYAGAGIGFMFVDPDVPENSVIEENDTQSAFAYQLIAGLSRPVSYHMEGFVEYRYFRSDQFRVLASGSAGDATYATDNIFLGLRMQF